jgi:hypothetical protein
LKALELGEADEEMGVCVDPEGNGVTMGRGAEGGPGPPSGEQDKQLICNSGGGETPMGEPRGQQRQVRCDIKNSSCAL